MGEGFPLELMAEIVVVAAAFQSLVLVEAAARGEFPVQGRAGQFPGQKMLSNFGVILISK